MVVSVRSFGLLEVFLDELLVELGNRSKTEGRRGEVPDVFKDKIRLQTKLEDLLEGHHGEVFCSFVKFVYGVEEGGGLF